MAQHRGGMGGQAHVPSHEFHIKGKGILQSQNIIFYYHPLPLCRSKITRNHGYLAKLFLNIRLFLTPFFEAATALCMADPDHDSPNQAQDQNPRSF